jgi:hypothetical protein
MVHYIPGRVPYVLEVIFFDASMEVKIYLLYIIFLSWNLLSLHLGSPIVLLPNIYPLPWNLLSLSAPERPYALVNKYLWSPLEFCSFSTWAALPSCNPIFI